jgi:hypothetical protein
MRNAFMHSAIVAVLLAPLSLSISTAHAQVNHNSSTLVPLGLTPAQDAEAPKSGVLRSFDDQTGLERDVTELSFTMSRLRSHQSHPHGKGAKF